MHNKEKAVSAKSLFKGAEGSVMALQILEKQRLKEHVSRTPAFLICIEGQVVFNNEQAMEKTLLPGDYVNIEPKVKHWVDAIVDSQLLLFK